MKASKKCGKARPVRQVPLLDRAADWVVANGYINIGLSRNQIKLLTLLGRHWGIKQSPMAQAARHLLCVALADLDQMKSRVESDHQYLNGEGFSTSGVYYDGLAKAALAGRGLK